VTSSPLKIQISAFLPLIGKNIHILVHFRTRIPSPIRPCKPQLNKSERQINAEHKALDADTSWNAHSDWYLCALFQTIKRLLPGYMLLLSSHLYSEIQANSKKKKKEVEKTT
jgi:hypothetical protein